MGVPSPHAPDVASSGSTQPTPSSHDAETACKLQYHTDMLLHHLGQASSSSSPSPVDAERDVVPHATPIVTPTHHGSPNLRARRSVEVPYTRTWTSADRANWIPSSTTQSQKQKSKISRRGYSATNSGTQAFGQAMPQTEDTHDTTAQPIHVNSPPSPIKTEDASLASDPSCRHDNTFLRKLQEMRERHRLNMELLETEGYSRPATTEENGDSKGDQPKMHATREGSQRFTVILVTYLLP